MKKLNVRVIPNAKKARVIEADGKLKVYVNAPAIEGKANEAVVEALAEHFSVKRRSIRIVVGEKSREKIIEIK